MRSVEERFAGPDLRSIGRSNEVAREILVNPAIASAAVRLLDADDPVVRSRAADALEKASRERPALIQSYRRTLLRLAKTAKQQEIKWHVAQMLPRLRLNPRERSGAISALRGYANDPSQIVQVCALQALWEVASRKGRREVWIVRFVRQRALDGGPAVRARAKRLLCGVDGAQP